MKFSDFIQNDAIIARLSGKTREDVISEMVASLKNACGYTDEQERKIYDALIAREELSTTGVGHGVAVPHAKTDAVDRTVGMIAVSEDGVDFSSLDCEKVKLFFLILSPSSRAGEHLRSLEYITPFIRDESFCRSLFAAEKNEDVVQILDSADLAD